MDILLTILEYLFIVLAQLFGIAFHIGQKIIEFDKAYPDKKAKEIMSLFFENEWSSLLVSAAILLFHVFIHAVIAYYIPGTDSNVINLPLIDVPIPWGLAGVLLAVLFGYGGQRIIYKFLGKGEKYLTDKAN